MAGALKVRVGSEWKTVAGGVSGGGAAEAFTVIGNATNQTTALQTALNAARDSTTIKTVRIHGTVLVDVHASGQAVLFDVQTGVTLEGVGYSSCIKFRPESFVQNPSGQNIQNWGIVYRSYATIRNLRIDGSRGTIASGAWGEYSTNGIGGDWGTPRTGVVFDHLWIHDIGGKNKESFTINCGGGETGITASYLWTWNNDGSGGVHLTGDPIGVHGSRAEISHIYAWNNKWQGMSTYGFDNARFSDCHAWDNDGNGFNNEWGRDIEYFDCVSHGNGFAGFGTYGDVDNINYHNPISYNNVLDVSNNWRGEFSFMESQIGAVQAGPKTVTINGGRVTPNSAIVHVYRNYQATVTTGKKFADVVINHPDAASWVINQPQHPGQRYKGLEYLRPVSTGTLASWTDGGVTTGAYAAGGTEGQNPVALSVAAQYSNRETGLILQPNRRYLVQFRARIPAASANKTWALAFPNAAGTDTSPGMLLENRSGGDLDQWFVFGKIVNISTAGPARLRWVNLFAGSNTLVVDWVQAYELPAVQSSEVVGPTVTGSRGGNAALASLLTELANQGVIVNGTVV